jgi:hypothetical protein
VSIEKWENAGFAKLDVNESSIRMLVAAGFMPAFKYLQKNSLMVLERGRKARGYELILHAP